MNPNDKQQTEFQNMVIALNQYGEQQKILLQKTEMLVTSHAQLQEKLTGFESRLANIKVTVPPIDTGPIQAILQEAMDQINRKLTQPPACGGRKFQFFPEKEAGQYFRAILVRCGMWLVILAGIFYLYKFSIHWLDQRHTIQIKAMESETGHKAWQYLYHRSDKKFKKKMDSILLKVSLSTQRDTLINPLIPDRNRASFPPSQNPTSNMTTITGSLWAKKRKFSKFE